jgi:hypothetical protein
MWHDNDNEAMDGMMQTPTQSGHGYLWLGLASHSRVRK